MPDLVTPTTARYDAWRAAHEEWGPGLHEDGFGLSADDDVSTPAGFAVWVDALLRDPGRLWWIVEGDTVVGGIALRPPDHPAVARHGHVGYGIRPSCRGRGLATWALGQVLGTARDQGLAEVVVVCAASNPASAAVAEHHAGRAVDSGVDGLRRYLVPTG